MSAPRYRIETRYEEDMHRPDEHGRRNGVWVHEVVDVLGDQGAVLATQRYTDATREVYRLNTEHAQSLAGW